MGNYFSWKMVLIITYGKLRKPSTPRRAPPSHEGGVEETVARGKGLSQCHHFLNASFSKENECKQSPGRAANRRIETEKGGSYVILVIVTCELGHGLFFFSSTRKTESDSPTCYKNTGIIDRSCL